jgi:hypothetical protein
MSGHIVDASLVAAPRQRNTDDEKAIKEDRQGLLDSGYGERGVGRYRLQIGGTSLNKNGFVSHIHRKKPKAALCTRRCGGPTMRNRKSARLSSSSPSKRIGWGYSSIGMANLVNNIKRFIFLRKIAVTRPT